MSPLVDSIVEDARSVAGRIDFPDLEGKSFLITGASGLLGVHILGVLRHLVLVHGLHLSVCAVIRSNPESWLSELSDFPGAQLVRGDLSRDSFVSELPMSDIVIHAAGYGQPGKFMDDPAKTILINTYGTAALLERLSAGGTFLFVSTAEVYSGSTEIPYVEEAIGTTTPAHPRACYIEGKRCGEALCHGYARQGKNIKIARLALAYGPGTRGDDARVLNSLIHKGLVSGEIRMLDGGAASRTYCYISDAIEIMLNMIFFGKNVVYNVGGVSAVTILELAHMIGKEVDAPVFPGPSSEGSAGAPTDVALDLTRVREEFLKTEFLPLDQGLRRTIQWQRELLRAP